MSEEEEESSLPSLQSPFMYVLLIQHNDALRQEPDVKFISSDLEMLRKYVQMEYCQYGYCKRTSEDEWTLRYKECDELDEDDESVWISWISIEEVPFLEPRHIPDEKSPSDDEEEEEEEEEE